MSQAAHEATNLFQTTYGTTRANSHGVKSGELTGNSFLYVAVCTSDILAFAAGTSYGWSSPVIPKLNLTNAQESWVTSCFVLGTMIAMLLSGFLTDRIGRKQTLLLLDVPALLSFVTLAFANDVVYFYASRFVQGVGLGAVFSVLPLYVAEISRDTNRGMFGCLQTTFLCAGILFSYCAGPYLSIRDFNFVLLIFPSVFLIAFGLFIPKSPYFLVQIEDYDGAVNSLSKLRGSSRENVQGELNEIIRNVRESVTNKSSLLDLFKSKIQRKAFIICLGLLLLPQLSGLVIVVSYMQSIFDAAGTIIPSEISTIIVGTMQVVVVGLSAMLADRIGRRIPLLISSFGSFVSLTTLGTYFYLKSNGHDVNSIFWLPLLSLLLYIVSANVGMAGLPWTVMGEIFTSEFKAVASATACFMWATVSFLNTTFFPYISAILGMGITFWIFAGFALACHLFVYFLVPETKGKSLAEVQVMLKDSRIR